jgi:hypothetical protein
MRISLGDPISRAVERCQVRSSATSWVSSHSPGTAAVPGQELVLSLVSDLGQVLVLGQVSVPGPAREGRSAVVPQQVPVWAQGLLRGSVRVSARQPEQERPVWLWSSACSPEGQPCPSWWWVTRGWWRWWLLCGWLLGWLSLGWWRPGPRWSAERSGCPTRRHSRLGARSRRWSWVSPRRPGSPPPCERRRWRVMQSWRGTLMLPTQSRGCGRRQRRDDGGCRTTQHWCGDRRRKWWPLSQARSGTARLPQGARPAGSTASAQEQGHRPADSRIDCADRVRQVGHVALLWAQSSSCSQMPFLILGSAAFHTITLPSSFRNDTSQVAKKFWA